MLEADQHLTERARHLREAGQPGTLDELRARAYLDALLGREPAPAPSAEPAEPAAPGQPAGPGEPAGPGAPASAPPSGPSTSTPPPGPPAPSAGAPPSAGAGPAGAGPSAGAGPAGAGPSAGAARSAGAGPSAAPAALTGPTGPGGRLAARINLTVPLATLLGLPGGPGGPGDIGGFGPIDPALARDITARAAAHPSTSWSLTITHTGQAIAHGPIPARRARRFLSHPRRPHDGGPGDGGPGDGGRGRRPPERPRPPGRPPGSGDLTVTLTPLARDGCDHRTEEFRYQPGQRLQNLIRARTATCSAPGCRRPAARCDLDHTIAFDHGGRSCECNLAPPRLR